MKARIILLLFFIPISISTIQAQFGAGYTYGFDLYQRYANPTEDSLGNAAGSALMNMHIGPKIWIGGKDLSLSLEAQANIGFFGYSLKENKGLGMISFPVIANINFARLSGLSREDGLGFYVGGGIQYNRTEAYGLKQEYKDLGITRDYFPTYIVQVGAGFGVVGFGMSYFIRYGFDPESAANTLNTGIQLDFNRLQMKKIDDPASRL